MLRNHAVFMVSGQVSTSLIFNKLTPIFTCEMYIALIFAMFVITNVDTTF